MMAPQVFFVPFLHSFHSSYFPHVVGVHTLFFFPFLSVFFSFVSYRAMLFALLELGGWILS